MSEEEFDAAAAARRATGNAREDVEDAATNQARAEGIDEPEDVDVGSSNNLRDMLFSTEPAPSLDAVEDPWDPERGGTTRIYRGLMKAAGFEGMPAIADLSIGALEAVQELNLDEPEDDQAGEEIDTEADPIV